MTTTNDLTAIEGIDINCSYEMICIDRLNTKVNTIDVSGLTSQVAVLTTKMNNSYITINVKDYGAVGNNINDDTTAFNNAISALNSAGILYIPKGNYKITGKLTIQNFDYVDIYSENAIITTTLINDTTFYINNCKFLQFNGRLTITYAGTATSNTAITLQMCNACNIANVVINGNFSYGFRLLEIQETTLYSLSNTITNCIIIAPRIGISIIGEYYNINNCYIRGAFTSTANIPLSNTLAGIENLRGNNNVMNCHINYYPIGILVDGVSLINPDHGQIVGCSLNHNSHISIFIKNVVRSMLVSNNQIWGTSGTVYQTFSVPRASTAQNIAFGIYLENAKAVLITGNTIALSPTNLGLDGCACVSISNNTFVGSTTTNFHIKEYGEYNTTYNRNCFNIITKNSIEGSIAGGYDKFYTFLDTLLNYSYIIKDNLWAQSPPFLFMNATGAPWEIGQHDSYTINVSNNQVATSSTNPADQTRSITILPHVNGNQFCIYFSNNSATSATWIKVKTTSASIPAITPNCNGATWGLSWSVAYKALKVINIEKLTIVPIGTLVPEWIITYD
jgi:hypothetical protein